MTLILFMAVGVGCVITLLLGVFAVDQLRAGHLLAALGLGAVALLAIPSAYIDTRDWVRGEGVHAPVQPRSRTPERFTAGPRDQEQGEDDAL